MNFNKSFFWGAGLSFLGLLFFTEAALRLAVVSGLWYRHLDPAGEMTSLPELRDRIRDKSRKTGKTNILLLGDSVWGASALLERGIPRARTQTLYRSLKGSLQDKGVEVLGLGSDGLLMPDLESLSREALPLSPAKVLILLNFRMFARDFMGGPKALSRKFLAQGLAPEVRERTSAGTEAPEESLLSDLVYDRLCEISFLFREAQMLKSYWYYPTRKDLFQRKIESWIGKDEDQADILEAALKQKTASYYGTQSWEEGDLPMASLKRTLDSWTKSGSPIFVVLTPQNARFLGDDWDGASSTRNRKRLGDLLGSYRNRGVRYHDWTDKYPSEVFLDHCHLTPEGNGGYSRDLAALLMGREDRP